MTVPPGGEKAKGDLIHVYKYLMEGCKEDRGRLFLVMLSERARGNGHELNFRKFHLNTRKHFVVVKLVMHWTRLPSEVVNSPSLEILKTWKDNDLSNLLWLNLL